jgi:hypothetical protein
VSQPFAQDESIPVSIRISRPLRDLLQTGSDSLSATVVRAWNITQKTEGAWCEVSQRELLGGSPHDFLRSIRLRAIGDRIDVQLDYIEAVRALASGRRLIVSCPTMPLSRVAVAEGSPLAELVGAPFLDSPAIIVQRHISRRGSLRMDFRCRCPSHTVRLDP